MKLSYVSRPAILAAWTVVSLLLPIGCHTPVSHSRPSIRMPQRAPDAVRTLETTGYCSCGKCCGWKRTWWGRPVHVSGPQRGQPKAVGITASGNRARRGVIAADTTVFPFGTLMYVPGYGYGRVEDRGSVIRLNHIDLYFHSHADALRWGKRRLKVLIWWPPAMRHR